MMTFTKIIIISLLAFCLNGCVGMVIGAATDATIEVVKIPFKVGGAVIDIVAGEDDEEEE